MYGPVRTVVWEGRSREAPPYPDRATALRVTPPHRCGLRHWYRKVPFGPASQAQPPLFPRKQRSPSDRPGAVQGAKRRSGPLTARTDLESYATRGKGGTAGGEVHSRAVAQRRVYATIPGTRVCKGPLSPGCCPTQGFPADRRVIPLTSFGSEGSYLDAEQHRTNKGSGRDA